MKKLLLSFILLAFLSATAVFGYSLSESDWELLDRVENQIIELIDDQSNGLSAELFVSYIDNALETRQLTEKQRVLLEIISDDISYYYYLWEYAGDFGNMTADQCYSDEYYDEQDQMCYYNEDEYYDDDQEYEVWEFTGDHEQQGESEVLAAYSISGDSINLQDGTDDIKNQEVWNIFTALIPLSQRGDFIRYEVTNDDASDTAAHVVQTDEDINKWILGVNLSAFYIDWVLEPEESYATLIHEFAHVLTLNKTQVRYAPVSDDEALYNRFSESCTGNLLQEGCLNNWAYLDDFIDKFWPDADYLEKVRNEEIYAYDDTPESFVTEYAATNPGEDIAESFTYFVMRKKAEWNTIADQKLRFFYDYKELDSLRKQIRSRLATLK